MKTNSRIMMVVALAIFTWACAGCATVKLDSPEKRYLAARTEFNLLLEQYIRVQDRISEADANAVRTATYAAAAALDVWEANLGKPYDFSAQLIVWLEAKNVLLDTLRRIYVD